MMNRSRHGIGSRSPEEVDKSRHSGTQRIAERQCDAEGISTTRLFGLFAVDNLTNYYQARNRFAELASACMYSGPVDPLVDLQTLLQAAYQVALVSELPVCDFLTFAARWGDYLDEVMRCHDESGRSRRAADVPRIHPKIVDAIRSHLLRFELFELSSKEQISALAIAAAIKWHQAGPLPIDTLVSQLEQIGVGHRALSLFECDAAAFSRKLASALTPRSTPVLDAATAAEPDPDTDAIFRPIRESLDNRSGYAKILPNTQLRQLAMSDVVLMSLDDKPDPTKPMLVSFRRVLEACKWMHFTRSTAPIADMVTRGLERKPVP